MLLFYHFVFFLINNKRFCASNNHGVKCIFTFGLLLYHAGAGGSGMRCVCAGGWGWGVLQTQMFPPDLAKKQKED